MRELSKDKTKWKELDWVAAIIEMYDQIRFDSVGGYASQWTIENGKVYWANIDDCDKVSLNICPVKKFIKENKEILGEDWT